MNITGTINAGVTKIAGSMKNSVNNCKVDGKIAEQEKKTKVICQACGAKTSSTMKYCGTCGASL